MLLRLVTFPVGQCAGFEANGSHDVPRDQHRGDGAGMCLDDQPCRAAATIRARVREQQCHARDIAAPKTARYVCRSHVAAQGSASGSPRAEAAAITASTSIAT